MYLKLSLLFIQSINLIPINHSNYVFSYIVNGFPFILVCYHNILEPLPGASVNH